MLNTARPSSLPWLIWLHKQFFINFNLLKDLSAAAVVACNVKSINNVVSTLGKADAAELYVTNNNSANSRMIIVGLFFISFSNDTLN